MTIPKNIKSTLRYQHLVARYANLPAYRQEAALRKEITNGPQWRIDAAIEAVNKTPYNWNYIDVTGVMKHAAMYGRLQTVEKISDTMRYEVKQPGKEKPVAQEPVQAAFHIASKHGRYRTADALAKRGAGPMYEARNTPPAIYTAIEEADFRKIDYLIRRGAHKDYLVNIAASSKQYMKVTKYLVEKHHAGVGHASEGFWTPFLTAVKYGRDDLAQYLLEHGAVPQNDRSAGEALYSAATRDNVKMVDLMLQIGFKADEQILHHAIGGGHVETAKLLVEKGGVSVNSGQQEALLLAITASKNAAEMTDYVLSKGADAAKALAQLKSDPSLYQYGNRAKMQKFLEDYLAPKAKPAAPAAPAP